MSVEVKVVGVPAGGASAPSSGTGGFSPSSMDGGGGGGYLPANDRMIADIRREMQSRGVVLVPGSSALQQIISQYSQQVKQDAYGNISAQFQGRRDALAKKAHEGYDRIDADIEQYYKSRLAETGEPDSKSAQEWARALAEQERDKRYRAFGREIDREEEPIDREEQQARDTVDRELVSAIKQLTQTFEDEAKKGRGGQDEDSYIGRLRAQQRALIQERDAATTEEGAMSASKRLAGVNEQLRKAMGGGDQRYFYDPALQATQGFTGLFESAGAGDLGGTIMGAGGLAAGLSGMSMKAALKFLGWVGVAAGAAKWLTGSTHNYEQLGDLAALRYPAAQGSAGAGGNAVNWLNTALSANWQKDAANNPYYNNWGITSYGLLGIDSREDFVREASNRIHARGTSDHWYRETMRQIALEQSYGLSHGSLQTGGQYDRYGMDVTEALTRMVAELQQIKNSGVSETDFTRVQEKYDIQQQIMAGFAGRADRPDYNVANNMLAAFSAVKGITQDARIGSDYQQFSDMLQNPMNDRMRTLIYSTIEDIMPETRGRLDLIDRALRDPNNEGKIMQAVVSRITEMFGGTDTQMGYFAFKQLLPGITPDRLDKYIQQFFAIQNGGEFLEDQNAGSILANTGRWKASPDAYVNQMMDIMVRQAGEFKTGWSEFSKELKDSLDRLSEIVTGVGNVLQTGHLE